MRDNCISKKLHYTKDQIAAVERLKRVSSDRSKKWIMKKITGVRFCQCREIAEYQIETKINGAIILEFFCSKCKLSIYERCKSEPEDPHELAKKWGMTKVESVPHYHPEDIKGK